MLASLVLKYQVSSFGFPLQYDAFEMGIITTDDFTNADILEATYPAVAKRLTGDWMSNPAIPIVTGFLGKVLLFKLLHAFFVGCFSLEFAVPE